MTDAKKRRRRQRLQEGALTPDKSPQRPPADADLGPLVSEDQRLNAYWCPDCHGYVVTEDVDKGVTPMFLACRVLGEPDNPANTCKGRMHSMMYPKQPWPDTDGYDNPIPTEPTWEWYMPDAAELKRLEKKARHNDTMAAGMLDHHQKGGLALRRKAVNDGEK